MGSNLVPDDRRRWSAVAHDARDPPRRQRRRPARLDHDQSGISKIGIAFVDGRRPRLEIGDHVPSWLTETAENPADNHNESLQTVVNATNVADLEEPNVVRGLSGIPGDGFLGAEPRPDVEAVRYIGWCRLNGVVGEAVIRNRDAQADGESWVHIHIDRKDLPAVARAQPRKCPGNHGLSGPALPHYGQPHVGSVVKPR